MTKGERMGHPRARAESVSPKEALNDDQIDAILARNREHGRPEAEEPCSGYSPPAEQPPHIPFSPSKE